MIDKFRDRFEQKTYENNPMCFISLFDNKVIEGTQIQLPMDLFSRIIRLGQAYNLHFTSLFDLFGHLLFEPNHCKDLCEELVFLREVTNDPLLANHLNSILELAEECIRRNNCKLLMNGD